MAAVEEKKIYPQYFIRLLHVSSCDGDYARLTLEQDIGEDVGIELCMKDDQDFGGYESEKYGISLALETYYFSTKKDRDCAHEAMESAMNHSVSYDNSKRDNTLIFKGKYNSFEERDRELKKAKLVEESCNSENSDTEENIENDE